MALKQWILTVCIGVYAVSAPAALHDPFPIGASMSTLGTILWSNGITGRQPWIPAAFCADSSRWGLASTFTDYYDMMDNLPGAHFRQSAVGGWFALKKMTLKMAYIHFNALNIYYEQKGFCSIGAAVIPHVNLSVELEGFQSGLRRREERERLVSAGAAVWVPWSFASVSLSCRNILIKNASQEGFAAPFTIAAGIHTAPHRFGAQGVLFEIVPQAQTMIRFHLGMEYWLHHTCAIHASFASQPQMLGFGMLFRLPTSGLYAGLVHHPVLGWSKGVGMEYSRR
jgi:hypothetical protein